MRFAFAIYDINGDGYISNGELFKVLKMMISDNLTDIQLQQLVDRTIIQADTDMDGKISFEEFCRVSFRQMNDPLADDQRVGCGLKDADQPLTGSFTSNKI